MQFVKAKFVAFALIALALPAVASTPAQEQEVRVTMKDLPTAVQQTVKAQSKGAVVRGLTKEIENGQTYYEVSLKVAGHIRDVLIGADGKVVEVEDQVALNSVPQVVKAEFMKQAGKGKILLVESVTKEGALVFYEAHLKKGTRIVEVKVSPEGQLVK